MREAFSDQQQQRAWFKPVAGHQFLGGGGTAKNLGDFLYYRFRFVLYFLKLYCKIVNIYITFSFLSLNELNKNMKITQN